MCKILLLSAYDAVSHQYWRKGLVKALPEYEWTVLTLPPRHFSWRIRGNSLSWAYTERDTLERRFDLIIATSMTDLSALIGMVPSLAHIPSLLYFHENQFDYPASGNEYQSIEPKVTSIYAALSATRIAFNSDYNRSGFLRGVDELLRRMPDHVPLHVAERLREHSQVLPVPLMNEWFEPVTAKAEKFTLLWNHRWEFDKAPERFFSALLKFRETGADFKVHVVGQQFRKSPVIFDQLRDELSGYIGEWGYIEDINRYREVIAESHVVVSTSLHDFQGLSILEAVAADCIPVVPDRLAYQEYLPAKFRYPSFVESPEKESEALQLMFADIYSRFSAGGLPPAPDISALKWKKMSLPYRTIIDSLLA